MEGVIAVTPPLVCFVTFNRAGLIARNLAALLNTTEDFELYIIDNNSQDDTWKFIESLKDDRIKCKKRFDLNRGVVYAINYALSKRKKDQYFIHIDCDVYIKTKDWITQFMKVMNTFPEIGLLGVARDTLFQEKNISPKIVTKDGISYYQYHSVIGSCICLRPELFDYIGYFNEETCWADVDTSLRINRFTPYKTGFIQSIEIEQTQYVRCEQCMLKKQCTVLKKSMTCLDIHKSRHKHGEFAKKFRNKLSIYLSEVNAGKRTVYCASIHDPDSIRNHVYNKEWAEENFQFYIDYAN
ncbi:MAG: hypothetical protein PWR27_572 [Petroclostridium sp.]|jgi:glycosyltransferase involved in cell wall biosynthesis|uniref:glycosyltransferase n=1 Tax=Petroclostridium xylanilyticum TaxID=1792311 RepID=UPI0018E39091|nr:glycosyltransferase family A protein [Petroclostridium xylanilyticum]MDK2809863.1 hypothetical protein [Petroclostridium sp.]